MERRRNGVRKRRKKMMAKKGREKGNQQIGKE